MGMPRPRVRTPRYLTRFHCLGSGCEDNCCAGWQSVDVDEESYARYRQVDHPDLGPALRLHVLPNREPAAGPEDYALIEVPDGGCCPFFTAERLCAVQAALGEALLPAGCDTFPRQATLIDGVLEVAGRFSCPEVTRLALLTPDALELVEVEPERRLRERARYWVEVPWLDLEPGDPRRHYHRVRELSVGLLRRREVSLEARLQSLGRALGTLSAHPGVGRAEVERAFAETEAGLPPLQQTVDATPRAEGPHELLLKRLRPWIAMPGLPPRYRACLDRLRDGLGLPPDPAAPLERTLARAYRAGLGPFRAYVLSKPHVLENALVNQIYVTNFPFHPRHTFFEEYAIFGCRYALLKLHLIGAAAAEGALSDALVVETVQAFDKYADSPEYWQRSLDLLRREAALDLPSLAALVLD